MKSEFDKALRELRGRVENPRFGPILNDKGFVLFEFDGVSYQAPEPMEIMFGVDAELDRKICVKALLDKTAARRSPNA